MAIEKAFNIAIPNQPYVDDFSDGTEHASVYNGDRYIKFQYHAETGHIVNVIGNGDTEDEMVANEGPLMEGHLPAVLDADAAPLHAALITRHYTTGEVADYTENLGTTDAEGNAETWEHFWNDGTGLLSQIYNIETMKWVDNAIVMPEFKTHGISRESFLEGVNQQIAACTSELARNDVYSDGEIATITAYKTTLEGIETKYADVLHWKIPFPQSPTFK
tara:strand:- start:28 stop:684 length:657 start_codon:yes stop_codon:yes gene_type:complete